MRYGYYKLNKNYNAYANRQWNKKQEWIKKHNEEKKKEVKQ